MGDVHSDHKKIFEASYSCTKSFRNPFDTSLPCIRSRTGFTPGQVSISVNGTKLQIRACFKKNCAAGDTASKDIDVSLK